MNEPDIGKRLYEYTTYEKLYKEAGDYPLEEIVNALGFEDSELVAEEIPGYAEVLGRIYTEDNLEIMKANIITNLVYGTRRLLDKQTLDDVFEINKKTTDVDPPSYEKYAADIVRDEFKEPITQLYLQKYPSEDLKNEITEVCKEVAGEYKLMIEETDWLSPETKAKAVEKLENLKINVAYPDKFRDYTSLDLKGKNLLEIVDELGNYSIELQRSRINSKVDKT